MTNKFISILDKIGTIGKNIWKVAEPVIKEADVVAKDVEPEIAILFPALSPLWNMTVTLVGTAESAAAAAGAQKAGAQKLAFVIAALLPYAIQEAANLGISAPTQSQIVNWVNGAVLMLQALGSL